MIEINSSSKTMHEDADLISTESPNYFSYLGEKLLNRLSGQSPGKTSSSRGKATKHIINRGSPRALFETIYLRGANTYVVDTHVVVLLQRGLNLT